MMHICDSSSYTKAFVFFSLKKRISLLYRQFQEMNVKILILEIKMELGFERKIFFDIVSLELN